MVKHVELSWSYQLTKGRRLTTLQRPAQLIYPLGVTESETQEESETTQKSPNLSKKETNPNFPNVHETQP